MSVSVVILQVALLFLLSSLTDVSMDPGRVTRRSLFIMDGVVGVVVVLLSPCVVEDFFIICLLCFGVLMFVVVG